MLRHRVAPRQPDAGDMAHGFIELVSVPLPPPRMLRKRPRGEPQMKRFLGWQTSGGTARDGAGVLGAFSRA